jgi:site-specific DNA-methyltransferase (adenine-specific)
MTFDLRHGRYDEALDPWGGFDAIITDPPYGAGTHAGWNKAEKQVRSATGQATRTAINYNHWTPDDVAAFVRWAASCCRGWICAMTSDDLAPVYHQAYLDAGLYAFAAVPIIQPRPRLTGDGPSSWTVWLMVARPRSRTFATWGCLPGAYMSHTEKHGAVAGAKPLELMRAIVRDYSRPGDLVCDPCAGGGTTLLAALWEGRQAIGAELDADTHAKATRRLAESAIPVRPLFNTQPAIQTDLMELLP